MRRLLRVVEQAQQESRSQTNPRIFEEGQIPS